MRIEKLTISQVKKIYRAYMIKDFPADERKPLAMILKSMKQRTYECLGMFEAEELLGYAFFVKTDNDYLFDYFATCEKYRNQGIGAEFLKQIARYYQNVNSIVGEVEDPECADNEEERELQDRRYHFYLRNGYIDTRVRVKLFGVDYIVLALDKPEGTMELSEIKELYLAHYKRILPGVLFRRMVKIK